MDPNEEENPKEIPHFVYAPLRYGIPREFSEEAWLPVVRDDYSRFLKANPTAFADCQIVCGGQTFDAQRLLLSSRSVVFAAMFDNEFTKEAQTKVVEIEDMSPETVAIFLEFMRHDALPDEKIKGREIPLMDAAEKYQMISLKRAVEVFMVREMEERHNYDIVASAAYLSSVYGLFCSRVKFLQMMTMNKAKVIKGDAWMELRESNPKIAKSTEEYVDKLREICFIPLDRRGDFGIPMHFMFADMVDYVDTLEGCEPGIMSSSDSSQ